MTAPLVFAGYGITACEYGYDDYGDIDARGKVVLILRHEPQEYEASSTFEGRIYTEHSQIFKKLLNAKAHGAKGVLLVNDTGNHSGPDNLDRLTALPSPGGAGIPFFDVKAAVVEPWFTEAGKNFAEMQSELDRTLRPHSFVFPNFTIEMDSDVNARAEQISNVAGYLPGATAEYVVVGAHYDHLGNGEQFSLAPDKVGTLHPGADDNASGTAAVIELARWFGSQPKLHRGVLFVTFAGEEIGLLGSTEFTTQPPFPLSLAVAMINMDMIGRMREHKLTVGGVNSGTGLRDLTDAAARQFPFDLQTGGDAVYGLSDHTAFTSHSIPMLFFFTGLHADYHRPGDTVDKIDSRSTALITDLVATVITSLAEAPERPRFLSPGNTGNTCSTGK